MNQRIIYQNESGGVSVVIPVDHSLSIEQVAASAVPEGVAYQVVDVDAIPSDRTFRGAWEAVEGAVVENIGKAKDIAHDLRRKARSAEFAPLDVKATIPAAAAEAEAERQVVREKYAQIQTQIDGCGSVGELKAVVETL